MDRIARQQTLVAEHIRAENEKNWPAVYDTFVQDDRAFYDVMPLGTTFPGIAGVHQFYEMIAAASPDFQIGVTAQYDVPGCTICETVISGTHLGPFLGVPASGNHVEFKLAAFYLFNEDSSKLLAERVYFDLASLIAQMQRGVPQGQQAARSA